MAGTHQPPEATARGSLRPAPSDSPSRQIMPEDEEATEIIDTWVDLWWAAAKVSPEDYAREPWRHFREAHNAYLSIRMSKRGDFLDKLDWKMRKRVDHEMTRIRQTRANFSADVTKMELMEELESSRLAWKEEVVLKTEEYRNETEKRLENAERFLNAAKRFMSNDSPYYQNLIHRATKLRRDKDLLDRIRRWNAEDAQDEPPTEPKVDDLYGFKAGAIYFKRSEPGSDWLGCTIPHPSMGESKFPNQMIMVNEVLHNTENNPLRVSYDRDTIRWFHFPANNMAWVEKAMAMYYGEEPEELSDFEHHGQLSRAERLLSREFWRGQMRGTEYKRPPGHHTGVKGPIHARHMRSRCSIIPRDPPGYRNQEAETSTSRSDIPGKNLAFFLPYLHWETSSRRSKMVQVINEVTNTEERRSIATVVRQLEATKKPPIRTLLGKYLMKVAEVADRMDYEADERLLRENIENDPPMHTRRTLDQYYFSTLQDTSERDTDQVVYRGTNAGKSSYMSNTRVVMVDQLWLWILDDNTIITSFPRQWGRKTDPSSVNKSLRERLRYMNQRNEGIKSIHHLATIIVDQCSRVFFDRTIALDERPEVMDLFSSAIERIIHNASIAYDIFWRHTYLHSMGALPDKYLDINSEGAYLQETQDIAEELKIMLRIYTEQETVVREFRRHLGRLNGELKGDVAMMHRLIEAIESSNAHGQPRKRQPQRQYWLDDTVDHVDTLLEDIRSRKMEIQDLEEEAIRTQHQVQLEGLLQLKQQQASIIEANAALKGQEESIRQGRAIMAFTVVTIFFLPLGFFATFFGMNNQDINEASWMSLREQVGYMFGLSAVVIAISVGLAFSPWMRALGVMLVRVPLFWVGESTGICRAWDSLGLSHEDLERRNFARLEPMLTRRKERKAELKYRKAEGRHFREKEKEKEKERALRRGSREEDEGGGRESSSWGDVGMC